MEVCAKIWGATVRNQCSILRIYITIGIDKHRPPSSPITNPSRGIRKNRKYKKYKLTANRNYRSM